MSTWRVSDSEKVRWSSPKVMRGLCTRVPMFHVTERSETGHVALDQAPKQLCTIGRRCAFFGLLAIFGEFEAVCV